MKKDQLGNRMKAYENIPRIQLTPRMPIIVRVDGCHFHTYTKPFNKPWDNRLRQAMVFAAKKLLSEVGGAGLVYVQSDEISVLINPYKKFETQQYFGGNVQKISSVSASIATVAFNSVIKTLASPKGYATFDGRCFVIPREDVSNYFLWRWKDCVRNSVSGLAQAHFSAKQLNGVNQLGMKEKLSNKGIVWENCSAWDKWGTYITSLNDNEVHCEFLDIKSTIEKLLEQEEE